MAMSPHMHYLQQQQQHARQHINGHHVVGYHAWHQPQGRHQLPQQQQHSRVSRNHHQRLTEKVMNTYVTADVIL
jgi:hypothetical protein